MIAGTDVYTCNECIDLCNEIIQEDLPGAEEESLPDKALVGAAGKRSSPFTPRETELLRLVQYGLTLAEIARYIQIAHGTIRTHLANIRTKLELIEEGSGGDNEGV